MTSRIDDHYVTELNEYIRSILIPGYDFDIGPGNNSSQSDSNDNVRQLERDFTASNRLRLLFVATSILAVITTVFHFLYYSNPFIESVPFLSIHLMLMGSIVFLTTIQIGGNKLRRLVWNSSAVVLIVGLILASIYVLIHYRDFPMRSGAPIQMDVYISTALIFITIEGARRAYGNIFGVLGVLALIYGLFGNYFPGFLQTGSLSWERLATGVVVPDLVGLYGFLLNLSATLIAVFIFFGIFLQRFGGARFFGELAIRVGSRLRSGPAQVAIISSGLMGMLNGTAVANVAATGSFTIPLMKEMGYDDDFAGAVESVASIGGQLTPPVMGAGAFVMASILGLPFLEIVAAASLPALFYYFTIMMTAHIRAVKVGMQPYQGEVASLTSLLYRSYFFIPVLVIIYSLVDGDPASLAAWRGVKYLIALYIAFTILQKRKNPISGIREVGVNLIKALDSGARTMAPLVILLAELAWIIQLLNTTGILNKIAAGVIFLANGQLLLVLILSAFISVIFGFGIPTTAAYLIVALVGAPAIIQLGIDPVGAHLFVFYFAILSAITPPVAAACLVASGISEGRFLSICAKSIRMAFPAIVLPFIWIYNPTILGRGPLLTILISIASIAFGLLLVVSFFENYLLTEYTIYERIGSAVAAIAFIIPLRSANLIGLIGFAAIVGYQLHRSQIDVISKLISLRNSRIP